MSPATVGHGSYHWGAAGETRLHLQIELARLVTRRHPSVLDEALERAIADVRAKLARQNPPVKGV